jgi:uncharacterized protein
MSRRPFDLAVPGLRLVRRLPSMVLIAFFRLWQLLVSPTYGQTCRFYPTCSSYGVQAVREHGALRGGWLTLRRILRCHPWNPGGVDLVPSKEQGHTPSVRPHQVDGPEHRTAT